MKAWTFNAVELPFGNETRSWWIDASGLIHDWPIPGCDLLPGRYVLAGLVDAHAHPAIGAGPAAPLPLDKSVARTNLRAWAQTGITLVRDVGSPGGVSLELESEPGMPMLQAAGRFLAPAGRYFPELLGSPVGEADLVSAGLGELDRGARWVKVIADFPNLTAGTDAEATYPIDSIAQLTAAVHQAGGRVAAHSTLSTARQLIAVGIDSIEHGFGLDETAVRDMARRGTAWTPTIGALFALLDEPHLPPGRRQRLHEGRERLAELLPLAAALGVPVLAGSDVTGSIPQEVRLLSQMGLKATDALAAASVWPRRFFGAEPTADIVTYHHDPREDPDQLRNPAAVVVGGTRLR
jgi:imidazolonepropionase-like amidohydrolase